MRAQYEKFIALIDGNGQYKWVDQDDGQIDIENPPVTFPCALLKIVLPVCESLTDRSQRVTGQLIIRTADNLITRETSAKAPEEARARGLAYWDIVDSDFTLLQGYTDAEIELVERVSSVEQPSKFGLKIVKSVYSFIFEDQAD